MLNEINNEVAREYEIINKLMYYNPQWDFEQTPMEYNVQISGIYDMNWSQFNKFVQLLHDGPLSIEFNTIYDKHQ